MVRTVEMLSGGQRQAVAIARAATRLQTSGPGAILLDEPTAALGVAQRRRVDDLVERLAQSGHLVVVVSHDLPAVFQFAHRILVMRLGRLVAEVRPADSDLQTLVGLITGAIDPAGAAPPPEEAR
jgi:ABC-type sugar transport system ATPase subunit